MRPDRFLTLWLAAPWRRLRGAPPTDRLPILMYHSISDDPEPERSAYYKVCTAPARFAEQMRWLKDHGYRTDGVPTVAITFDDGYRDNFTVALPVLEECGFTATIYLPTGFIGDQRHQFKGRDCLTWGEVREMRQRGIRFGAHTVTHQVLRTLGWDQIETELCDSKRAIEDRLQEPVTSFAYPYAFPQEDRPFVARFRELIQTVGYTECVTTIVGRVRAGEDPLTRKRIPINNTDDPALFAAKLTGAYDWVGTAQDLYRRRTQPLAA